MIFSNTDERYMFTLWELESFGVQNCDVLAKDGQRHHFHRREYFQNPILSSQLFSSNFNFLCSVYQLGIEKIKFTGQKWQSLKINQEARINGAELCSICTDCAHRFLHLGSSPALLFPETILGIREKGLKISLSL